MAEMIRKASTKEIVNHWILTVSCIVLIVTGYGFLFQLKQIGVLFGGFHAHGDRDFVKTGRHGKSELHHDESSFVFPSGNQRETRESSAPDRFRRRQGLNFLRKEAECRSR